MIHRSSIRALVLGLMTAVPLGAAVLPNPAITAATAASSTTNAVAGIFDNLAETTEYRTNAAGNNTFIEFDFGTEVVIDGFLNVTRGSTSSVVTGSRLIFDTDGNAGFSAVSDTVIDFTAANTGQVGQGYLNRFAPVTARKVRWQVTANTGSSHSCGAMEMRFLGSTEGTTPVTGVGVIGGSTALDAYHALANASNGLAGRTLASGTTGSTILPAVGYAGNGSGTHTFVDFDLGQRKLITAVDFFDQLGADQRVHAFSLTFSNDPAFASPVAIRNYSNSGFSLSDAFTAIPARYVRYQVTSCTGTNPGLSELVFYETSGASLSQAFSAESNPNQNWSHGEKASPLAADLTVYQAAAAPDSAAPCRRWLPEPEAAAPTAFVGLAPSAIASFSWGGIATDWSAGSLYHAWRGAHGFPVVSRFTVPQTGAYDLAATWQSHAVAGCEAIVAIVVNGSTVFSADLTGFAGTPHGTPAPFGIAPVVTGAASGIRLVAGSTVDIVTQPLSTAGNLAVESVVTPVAVPAELTATLVIREFCASNLTSLRDEDGTLSDWIEIYNGTGAAVDLTNWSLTDKAYQPQWWVFPQRVLPHGQSLLVFASNKDAVKRPGYGPTSQLHTNFALSKAGEFLGLADASGVFVDSFAPAFPTQFDDLSYGLGSNGITGYLAPTPGAANGAASLVPPALLAFSAPSGLFSTSLSVTISGYSTDHTVRYTTNGTEPTLAIGQTYTGTPLVVSANTTLRARAYANGVPGPLAQASYTKLGTTVQYGVNPATFTSALPVLIIDAPSTPPTDKTPLVARFTLIDRNPADGLVRLADPPSLATRGTIKLRGQWSSTFPKKSYTIELWDGADQDAALSLLGMPAESDWTLYASYQTDTDFMRNVLMYELYRRMGRWAPRTRFVEVFFNTGAAQVDGASYHGVYVLREKIKIDPNRVDITRMSSYDNTGETLTGGYIIAHDKYGNFEQTHPELLTGNRDGIPHWPYTGGGAFIYKTPSVTDITAAQKTYISDYVLQTDTAITSPGFTHPVTGLHYTDYIGRDSFIDHHQLMAFAKNLDAIRISTYFEKDRGGKLKLSSLWDNDLSQDSDTAGADDNPYTWNSDVDPSAGYTDYFSVDGHQAEGWFHYLHQDPAYMQDWVDRFDRWRTTGVLEIPAITAFLDARATELVTPDNNGTASANTPIARNFARWPRTTRSTATNGSNAAAVVFGTSSTSEINRHKTWLQQRLDFMDSWVLRKPVPSLASGVVSAGATVTLGSPDLTGSAKFYHTLDGSDPFAPSGGISPTAIAWTGPLPLTASTRLTARLYQPVPGNKHTRWSAPLVATYMVGATPAASNNLVISELMYHPAEPSPAEIAAGFTSAEDFEFVELRNAGATSINLWGARFTQGIGFDFDDTLAPAQVELGPGQVLLLVSRRAAFEFRYGAAAARVVGEFANGTNLNNAGETLTLLDREGALLLEFTYTDVSPWPVVADGGGSALHYLGGHPAAAANWLATTPDPGRTIADHDGDGQEDAFEWLAGTDPADAGSQFRIIAAAIQADGGFTIEFPVMAGHRYQVEHSPDMVEWLPLGAAFNAIQTGTASFADPNPGPFRGFYRVAAGFAP